MELYSLLNLVFMLTSVVFPFYALPALHTAHSLSWRRALALIGLAAAPTILGATGFAVTGIFLAGLVDTPSRDFMRLVMTMQALSLITIFFISLLQGVIFCKVANNWTSLRLFIRNGWIACLLLFIAFSPFFFVNLLDFYDSIPNSATYAIAASVLIGWHALLAKGLFRWAKTERRRWRIRNDLCVHCQYSVIGLRDTLCPECGKPWRE